MFCLLRYVPERYKTQQICDKAILENGGTLKFLPDCYKIQEMYNKAVDNYPYVLEFVPERYKTQKKNLINLSVLIFLQQNLFLMLYDLRNVW